MSMRPAGILSSLILCMTTACSGGTSGTASAPAPARAAVAAPTRFEYAAGTSQYRFTAQAKISQNMMGQTSDRETSNMRLLTVTLARAAADTLSMTVVIDSITLVAAMGMSPPGVDKLPGTTFQAKVAPSGSMYSATGPTEAESPLAAQMTTEVGRMLPVVKKVLAPGATWVDTLTDTPRQNGLELNRQVITTFRVVGDTTVGGASAWKIERLTAATATGTGGQPGQQMNLEMNGIGKGFLLMSRAGVLLGSENEDRTTGKVVMAANGMELGIVTTTTTRVVKVK